MTTTTRDILVGIFHEPRQAQEAIRELKRAGFRDEQIGVASRDDGKTNIGDKSHGTHAEEGAVAGMVTGAGVGGLWALGIAAGMLPAIGPVIAGGLLGSVLASAAAGAAAAGLAGALVGMGIPEEEAKHYESEFKTGRTVVTVRPEGRRDEAWSILNRFGAQSRSMENAATTQHTAGTGSRAPLTSSATSGHLSGTGQSGADSHRAGSSHRPRAHSNTPATGLTEGERKLELREEELHVEKRPVETGAVQVRKEVHTEQRTVNVPVSKEEVVIERRPTSGAASTGEPIHGGETVRVPVREEEIHVEKQPVVKEEVVVGKRRKQSSETVSDTVRKEEVRVEREGDADVRERRS